VEGRDDRVITAYGSIGHSVVRALVSDAAKPVLVLAEGVAGTGKSHLLKELGALREAADSKRVLWQCGVAETQPREEQWEGPVLLLVDDVHRATEEEQQQLRRVLETSRPGLAAVITYRPEELAFPGLPLGTPAVRYPSSLTVLRHQLTVWDRERIRRVAAKVLEDRCTTEAVDRLHERSGGVPQVVLDVLSAMSRYDEHTYTAEDVDAAGVPVRLTDLPVGRSLGRPRSLTSRPARAN
jgi:hypothetical protein